MAVVTFFPISKYSNVDRRVVVEIIELRRRDVEESIFMEDD